MPVTTLCPALIGLASSLASDFNSPKPAPISRALDLGHLDRVEAGLHERARHLCGQRLGALVGPHEVVADGGGDRVLQLGADLGPVLRRIAGVDDLLGVLGDGPEPAAQVVVDIGGQVGDAVVEHLLPQRGVLQRVLRLLLAPLQIRGQPVAGVRDR